MRVLVAIESVVTWCLLFGIITLQVSVSSFLINPSSLSSSSSSSSSSKCRSYSIPHYPTGTASVSKCASTSTSTSFCSKTTATTATQLFSSTSTSSRKDIRTGSKGISSSKSSNNNNNNDNNNKKKNQKDKSQVNNKNSNLKKKKLKKKKKKKHKTRHSKEELNDIVRNIGLTPVISTPNKKKIVTMEQQSQSQLKSLHSITTNTQLQYARNGHAALRSIIPTQILKSIKNELKLYSTTKEIEAWKQKVEVAISTANAKSNSDMDTNAVMDIDIDKILESCTSVSKCKTLLKQYNNDNDNDEIIIPFLQHFNTWQSTKICPTVHDLVTSPFLSNMAKQLLDVPTVKLYQDSLFHKRYDDGATPWHSDARMAPFDTSNMITFWIPLDYIPDVEDGGTGLWFVDKSHSDFALPFWNPIPKCDDDDDDDYDDERNDIYSRLEERYGGEDSVKHYMPLELGDCTVHSGWTLHCANGMMMFDNEDDNDEQNLFLKKDRYALAVTYVDGRAEIRNDIQQNKNSLGHDEDRQSYVKWIDDVEPRQCFEHPLVPTVWPQ